MRRSSAETNNLTKSTIQAMMQLRAYTTMLSLLVGIITVAQEVNFNVQPDSTVFVDDAYAHSDISSPGIITGRYNPYLGDPKSYDNLFAQPLSVCPNFYDRRALMPQIGGLGGYVTSTSLPGLMGIESGALSYTLSSDNFSFTPAVYVDKYGYFGGLITSLGFGGQMSFRINDRFSITAFGAYHTNAWSVNPAVLSNMQSSRFGGYGTWNINDNWSLSAGAQRVYNSATNRWQTVPIVMPTYKINGKAAIGFDVGGLLYQIVDYVRSKNSHGYGNPTIGPPVKPQIVIPPYNP